MRAAFAFIPLLLMVLAVAARADDAGVAAAFSHDFSGIETFHAHFAQTVSDEHGNTVQQVSGEVWAQRPGKLRWEIGKPYPQTIVADGTTIWRYEPDLEQVIKQPYDPRLGETPALLLSGEPQRLLKHYNIAAIEHGYRLTPRDTNNLFESLSVTMKHGHVDSMSLVDSFGQVTRITFSDVEVNRSIAADKFTFVSPKGVDVLVNQ